MRAQVKSPWHYHDVPVAHIYPNQAGSIQPLDNVHRGVSQTKHSKRFARMRKLMLRGSVGINRGLSAKTTGPINVYMKVYIDRANDYQQLPYHIFEYHEIGTHKYINDPPFMQESVEDRFEILWEKTYKINMTYNVEVVPPPTNIYEGCSHSIEEYIDLDHIRDFSTAPHEGNFQGTNKLYLFIMCPTLDEGWQDPIIHDISSRVYFDNDAEE